MLNSEKSLELVKFLYITKGDLVYHINEHLKEDTEGKDPIYLLAQKCSMYSACQAALEEYEGVLLDKKGKLDKISEKALLMFECKKKLFFELFEEFPTTLTAFEFILEAIPVVLSPSEIQKKYEMIILSMSDFGCEMQRAGMGNSRDYFRHLEHLSEVSREVYSKFYK